MVDQPNQGQTGIGSSKWWGGGTSPCHRPALGQAGFRRIQRLHLNAFDVLVHTEAVESAPLLTSMVGDHDRRDLAHAAFLTLDRLVQRQPAAMIDTLAADTALAASRPEMTAQ